MRRRIFSLLPIALIFICIQSLAQNFNEPVTVSPLIGDRLDIVEKNFFHLPPPIMGFYEAEFYLNPDSSLTAKITYQMNEIIKDTIIYNYLNLYSFKSYLIKKTIEKIKGHEQSNMDLFLYDNTKISASLYRLNESSLSLIKPNINDAINSGELNDFMLNLRNDEVQKIIIQEDVAVWPYALGGSLLGLIAGGIIGSSLVDNQSDDIVEAVFAKPVEKGAAIALGGLIGAALGLLVGIAIGNNITTDIEFVAHPMSGYSILEKRALLYSVYGYR